MTTPEHADAKRKAGHATMARQGADVGATDRIRRALKAGSLPISTIAERAHLSESRVTSFLHQLMGVTGGVVKIGTGKNKVYALFNSPEGRAAMALPAGDRVAKSREYVWKPLEHDSLSHMRLCCEGRK